MGAIRQPWRRDVLLALVAITAALLTLAVHAVGALEGPERQTVDARFAIRGPQRPRRDIVIVAVDKRSLQAINERLPIARRYYAQLIETIAAARPRLLGLDLELLGRTDAADDSALIGAVARAGPVLLTTNEDSTGPAPVPAGVKNARGAVLASGSIEADRDGILRRMLYAPVALTTFAVRAAELLQDHPVDPRKFPGNSAFVDFRGPPGTFTNDSMIDVLDHRVPAGLLTGRIVLVGVTDPVAKDVFQTAISSVPMPGVEFDANAITTILEGFPLNPAGSGLEIALIIALAALPALLGLRLSTLHVFAGVIAGGMLFLVAAQLMFDAGVIVSVPDPLLALALGTAGTLAVDSYVQRRQLRNLQEVFDLLPSPVSDFFISYRRGQSELAANTLREALAKRFGAERVFMDTDSIDAGQQWPPRIEKAIAAARAVLVVIGPQWLDARAEDGSRRLDDPRDWVRQEIEFALARQDIAIVPVLHDGAHVPREADLPAAISRLGRCQPVKLTGRDLDQWVLGLAESIQRGRIRALRDSLSTQPEPAPTDAA